MPAMTFTRIGDRIAAATLLLAAIVILAGCSADEKATVEPPDNQDGFTFFNVGAATAFADSLRERLEKSLGPDAIEYRGTIDLEINEKGYLSSYFPDLHQLNTRLNEPLGERVEHNIVKLMYRYAVRENLPFAYVEIVFSGYTRLPLFIKIRSRRNIDDIIQTLEEKYGQPHKVDQAPGTGRSIYWRDGKDVFLVSIAPLRGGEKEYRLMIVFSENLENLLAAEAQERREKEAARRRAGERAF